MSAPRSPSYPTSSLEDAIFKARQIYQKEHLSMMTPSLVAEAMGYTGVNGASLKAIASLKQYGLLEGRGDNVRLTKDAQTLAIDDPGSEDYKEALSRAACNPGVFSDILRQFPGPASERNIAVFLDKQGYKPMAAALVAKHYKDSQALVSGNQVTYGGGDAQSPEPAMPQAQPESTTPARLVIPPPAPPARPDSSSWYTPPTPGLPRVVQDGKMLSISAVVDLKGLRKLKRVLEAYEKLLEIFEDDPEPEGDSATPSDDSEDVFQ